MNDFLLSILRKWYKIDNDVIIDPNGASPFNSPASSDFLSIPVDIFDELCCWESAEIYRIFTICRDGIDLFCFRIRFPNWDKHFNTDMFVHWHGDKWNDGSTDDSASICKHRTRAFHSWDDPFDVNCRVLIYCRINNRWFLGKIIEIHSRNELGHKSYSVIYRKRGGEKIVNELHGSPLIQKFVSKLSRFKGARYYSLFTRLEKQIFIYIKNEKLYKLDLMKKKKQLKKIRIQEVLNKGEIILNDDTLQFRKYKKRTCLKSCLAFKKGWVNLYGIPKHWNSTKLDKNEIPLPKQIFYKISLYLNAEEMYQLSAVDKLRRITLIDPLYIEIYKTVLYDIFWERGHAEDYYRSQINRIIEDFKSNNFKSNLKNIMNFNMIYLDNDVTNTYLDFLKKLGEKASQHKEKLANYKTKRKDNLIILHDVDSSLLRLEDYL